MDVVFILDESTSITEEAFRNMTIFVGNVIERYQLGPNNIRVGVITYSDEPAVPIELGRLNTIEEVRGELILLTRFGGTKRTDLALERAQDELTGTRGRVGAARLAVLLTDGMSTRRDLTSTAAANLRSRGVEVFVVGVGSSVDEMELNEIATDLDSDHVLQPDNFGMAELNMFGATLSNRTCIGKQCLPLEYLYMYALINDFTNTKRL